MEWHLIEFRHADGLTVSLEANVEGGSTAAMVECCEMMSGRGLHNVGVTHTMRTCQLSIWCNLLTVITYQLCLALVGLLVTTVYCS